MYLLRSNTVSDFVIHFQISSFYVRDVIMYIRMLNTATLRLNLMAYLRRKCL